MLVLVVYQVLSGNLRRIVPFQTQYHEACVLGAGDSMLAPYLSNRNIATAYVLGEGDSVLAANN